MLSVIRYNSFLRISRKTGACLLLDGYYPQIYPNGVYIVNPSIPTVKSLVPTTSIPYSLYYDNNYIYLKCSNGYQSNSYLLFLKRDNVTFDIISALPDGVTAFQEM